MKKGTILWDLNIELYTLYNIIIVIAICFASVRKQFSILHNLLLKFLEDQVANKSGNMITIDDRIPQS